jgi:hypothetical protein
LANVRGAARKAVGEAATECALVSAVQVREGEAGMVSAHGPMKTVFIRVGLTATTPKTVPTWLAKVTPIAAMDNSRKI